MKGIKFTEQIIIHSDSETVFDYTQDYANRLKWDVFLKRAELIDGAIKADKGAKAYCVAKNGLGMVTEYVSFNRPKVTAIKMTKGPFMFQSFAGSWTFREVNTTETEVIFVYSFQLRFPFNLVIPFIRSNLQNNVKQRLVNLKQHIEQ
ncbi:SRPBCC family protein [Mucilaginibacter mali]|uniref:SRPBCC family protein n=1 Tax=Mucilaginibacter mali TaxID=2740462 RepID=A0A7D4QRS7_9SPHI|nr:SRPBCC family protein [Mucilaginibacter mali]QKJ29749.1 SRPBCC family protein [Mucilaginibacter mali]